MTSFDSIDDQRRNFLKLSGHGLMLLCGAPLVSAATNHHDADDGSELSLIRQQFIESLTNEPVDEAAVSRLVSSMSRDGMWEDVNYESERGGNWETREHLKRLEQIARAFQTQSSTFFHQQRLVDVLLLGLKHWVDSDFQNYNWWQMQIGVPTNIARILILLDHHLPQSLLVSSAKLLQRSQIRMTGQNRVWLSGIVFVRGLLTGNSDDMTLGAQAIWSELAISNEEGIQRDFSFHQHGPQLQFGNYGRSFAESMIMWASVLRGTRFAVPASKLQILGDYLLNGPRWSLWRGRMDINVCGRQFSPETPGNPTIGYSATKSQLERMQEIDEGRSSIFRAAAKASDNPVGHRNYWRTAFAIHRRPTWYSSLKMSSTHVIGTETANFENMQGRLFGDGCHLCSVTGREYDEIAPLWNWRRLPGITADQKIIEVYPTSFNTEYGRSAFAGGISMGSTGVSAMRLMREGVSANKAWFFLEESIVCLGAGVDGYSHGDVYSSIQQSRRHGRVAHQSGELGEGLHKISGGTWIHHDNVGYRLFNDSYCLIEHVAGNWQSIYPKYSDIPVDGEVFSLWVNHGRSPRDKDYAYALYPDVTDAQMQQLVEETTTTVIANNSRCAAIQSDVGLQAVFFKPGKLQLTDGVSVSSNKACILGLSDNHLVVCDPARQYEDIEIRIDGTAVRIDLPQGASLGAQVTIPL